MEVFKQVADSVDDDIEVEYSDKMQGPSGTTLLIISLSLSIDKWIHFKIPLTHSLSYKK